MGETYLNGYALLEKVRIQLNESGTAYVQGTDTTGKYSNTQIMDGINAARRYIYNLLLRRIPYIFETETTITGVDSVFSLPADFGILRYFKDSDGHQIHPIDQDQRRKTSGSGSDQHYYRRGDTLVLDKASVTETCTLIYYKKCREITQGMASAGGALSITLATTAKKIADYYNGMMIENVTKDWTDTIDDYATTRVATITETAAASDYYGIVCDMPEAFHHLYIPRAVFEITGLFPVVQERPSIDGTKSTAFTIFNEDFMAALKMFAGPDLDKYSEDMWCEHGRSSGGGLNIKDYD